MLCLVPLFYDLVAELSIEREAINETVDDAFEGLWVVQGFDELLVVADKVVVQLKTSRLLLADNDVADLQEHLWNLRVSCVESGRTLDASRALIRLDDGQEL